MENYGVYKTGGSIGENTNYFVRENLSKEDAKEEAKRLNKRLSKGEREYYRLKYCARSI